MWAFFGGRSLEENSKKEEEKALDTHVMCGGFNKSLKGEDRFDVRRQLIGGDLVTFVLVADGHGGNHVSAYIKAKFLERVISWADDGSADCLNTAVTKAFGEMHKECCDPAFDSGAHSAGATLTVCCVNATRGEVSSWNVGDSLALLVHNEGYVELGLTHRLEESSDERARVQAAGAILGRALDAAGAPGGPIRAFPGGLAVTRGIGDADCTAFTSAEPAWVTRQAPPLGGAILACSDGVWDHLSAEEATAVLFAGKYEGAASAAKQVVKTAISKVGMTDDTTAVVILFGPPTGSPDVSKDGAQLAAADIGGGSESADALPQQEPRHHSFLRHVGSYRGPAEHIAKEGDIDDSRDDSFGAVPSAAGGKHLRMSPYPSRPGHAGVGGGVLPYRVVDHDESVKGGVAFASMVRDMETNEDEDLHGDEGSSKLHRAPIWGLTSPEVANRQSTRLGPDSADSYTPYSSLPPTAEGDSSRGTGTPGSTRRSLFKKRAASRASLSRLFDRVVAGPGRTSSIHGRGSALWDEDDSKRSDFDEVAASGGSFNSSKDSLGASGSPPHLHAKRSTPWGGIPNMSRIVNTDPEHGWHSAQLHSRTRDESPTAAPASSPGATPSLAPEEPRLRSSIGAAAKAVVRLDWTSLGEPMVYLGQGEFATAHRTSLDGQSVAVKMLKKSKQEMQTAVQGIKREIMLMTLMKHPNVLPAMGLGEHDGKPFIVVELLASVLAKQLPREAVTVPFWVRWRELRQWPLSRSLDCGRQLAQALQYCHDDAFPGYRILHRDVKPDNIGFLANGDLVLFDFGLASLWRTDSEADGDAPRMLTGETGSLRYMAPEVALSLPYSHLAEVFSFGTVLWELCAKAKPFAQYLSPEPFKLALADGIRPKLSPKWPPALQALLSSCWHKEPSERPEFRHVVPQLTELLAGIAPERQHKHKQSNQPPQPQPTPEPEAGMARTQLVSPQKSRGSGSSETDGAMGDSELTA